MGFRVRLRVRISDLLAYITYFIVTVIIRFVQREANLTVAGTLPTDSVPAAGTLYKTLQLRTLRILFGYTAYDLVSSILLHIFNEAEFRQ